MIDADKKAFMEALDAAYTLYGKELTKPVTRLYWESLVRFDLNDVLKAMSRHVQNPDGGQFIPKPADIIRGIEGDSDSRGLQAWAKVERAVRTVGSYETVVFDEPAIMAAIENLGGWIRLCQMKEDEMPYRRNEFVKLYKGFLINPPERFPNKLIGISEGHNQIEFQERIAPPVIVGNKEKAMLILEHHQEEVPILRNMVRKALESKG